MSKHIYFVRHGESDSNADRIHRGPHAMLTENGKAQAATAAERFLTIPVEVIVTSSIQRAIDTGKVIAERIEKPVVDTLDIFVEYEYGTEHGLSYDDERHRENVRMIREKFLTHERHADEETFSELQERVRKVLTYLGQRQEEHILVVSHGRFIRFLFASICLGDAFTPAAFNNIDRTLNSSNTGITHIELRDSGRWVAWQWNDSAHLG